MTPTLQLALYVSCLRAELLGAVVIPHGDFAYDPSLVGGKNGSSELHKASMNVGQWVMSLEPDVIVMSTPHGMELTKDFLVYQNAQLSGCAVVGEDLHNASHPTYKVCRNMTTDKSTASEILDALDGEKDPGARLKATGILGFADGSPLPVGWGEVLPWTYVTNTSYDPPEIVVLSVPYSRYNHSVEMVPGLLGLGRALAKRLDALSRRIIYIVSSDLAHTHQASGPYGFCDCAEKFDKACGRWASTMESSYIREEAAREQGLGAMSCGYCVTPITRIAHMSYILPFGHKKKFHNSLDRFTGLVVLDGMLDLFRDSWISATVANYHPTYYGMLVAKFGPPAL